MRLLSTKCILIIYVSDIFLRFLKIAELRLLWLQLYFCRHKKAQGKSHLFLKLYIFLKKKLSFLSTISLPKDYLEMDDFICYIELEIRAKYVFYAFPWIKYCKTSADTSWCKNKLLYFYDYLFISFIFSYIDYENCKM